MGVERDRARMISSAVTAAQASDVGLVRDGNEDCSIVLRIPSGANAGRPVLLGAVADGMGGHAAGEIASRVAAEVFARAVADQLSLPDAPSIPEAIENGFRTANAAVLREASAGGCRGMGTTLTAALVEGRRLYVGHVGDSRAYLVRANRVKQITRDHTLVEEQFAAGILSFEAARNSSQRNLLRRALGARPSVSCDIVYDDLQDGDVVILSTDGMHGALMPQDIVRVVRASATAEDTCARLVSLARARDGSDNITAVCLGIGGAFGAQPGRGGKAGTLRRPILLSLLALVLAMSVWLGSYAVKQMRSRAEGGAQNRHVSAQPSGASAQEAIGPSLEVRVANGQLALRQSAEVEVKSVRSLREVAHRIPKQMVRLEFQPDKAGWCWRLVRQPAVEPSIPGIICDGAAPKYQRDEDSTSRGCRVLMGKLPRLPRQVQFYLRGADRGIVKVEGSFATAPAPDSMLPERQEAARTASERRRHRSVRRRSIPDVGRRPAVLERGTQVPPATAPAPAPEASVRTTAPVKPAEEEPPMMQTAPPQAGSEPSATGGAGGER